MNNPLKHIMKIFYANNNYSRYRIDRGNYIVSILGAAFYILITGFLILVVIFSFSPGFYKLYLNMGVNSKIFATAFIIITSVLLRITISENEIKTIDLTKEEINKAINYLIMYSLVVIMVIGFLTMKFLATYKVTSGS